MPIKLLFNAECVQQFRPVHIQWFPTNKCNLNCAFCSCSERDKSLEMDSDVAHGVIDAFHQRGCKAVTISGGGEPLCHPKITDMIEHFAGLGIKIGLVTNGLLLDRLSCEHLNMLTWCRISNGDDRTMGMAYRAVLERAVAADSVGWAFSHVVSENPNVEEIRRIVDFAHEHTFTHVRIVADITRANQIDLSPIKKALVDCDDLVIYQERKWPVPSRSCAIGYVKPMIDPHFRMFLCCGVQYALEEMSYDLPEALSMGDARDLDAVYDSPKLFSVRCSRCYYEGYNSVLRPLLGEIEHQEFI